MFCQRAGQGVRQERRISGKGADGQTDGRIRTDALQGAWAESFFLRQPWVPDSLNDIGSGYVGWGLVRGCIFTSISYMHEKVETSGKMRPGNDYRPPYLPSACRK